MSAKLVRDKIPAIMRRAGKDPKTHVATDREFRSELFKKLREEGDELEANPMIEELADVLEVFMTICKFIGVSLREVETQRIRKKAVKGGFQARIILEEP